MHQFSFSHTANSCLEARKPARHIGRAEGETEKPADRQRESDRELDRQEQTGRQMDRNPPGEETDRYGQTDRPKGRDGRRARRVRDLF